MAKNYKLNTGGPR